jgi:hypothetical protein
MKWWEIYRKIEDFFGDLWDEIMDLWDDIVN